MELLRRNMKAAMPMLACRCHRRPARMAVTLGAICAALVGVAGLPAPDELPAITPAALEATFNREVRLEFPGEPELTYAALKAVKPGLPEDEGKAGWEQLLANDFVAARGSLEKVLAARPGHRSATAGLVLLNELEGRPEDSIELYLARIRATAKSPEALAAINEMTSADHLPLDASERLGRLQLELINDPQTDPGIRTILASALVGNPRGRTFMTGAMADALLPKTGLITSYQVTVGPFGLYADGSGSDHRRTLLQRPFPPEAGFGGLDFKDPVPQPAPAIPPRATAWPRVTLRNPETIYGRLDIEERLPDYGHPVVFYTVTNLECAQETDAIAMLSELGSAVVYLNGLPIWTPEAGEYRAPDLYHAGNRPLLRVRLKAGHNPIVIKHLADSSNFSIRIVGQDWQPIPGLAVKLLTDAELAAIKVQSLRGQVVSEPVMAYDMAWRVGSADGRQKRRGLGDLVAQAQKADVTQVAAICRELRWRDYLSAITLAEQFRAAWPQSLVARLFEAGLQREIVAGQQAADGRYGVVARATIDALAKEFPKVYAVQRAELEIALERNDPDRELMLARKQAHDFTDRPLSHFRLAELYLKRGWKPEAEAEIGVYLEQYSAGDAYSAQAAYEPHRLAAEFYREHSRQSTYLKLRAEAQKAGQESPLDRALHLLTLGQPGEGLKLLKDEQGKWPVYTRHIAWEIARYQQRLGNWDAFGAALEARLERNPYSTQLARQAIDVAVRRGLTEEALAAIDRYTATFGATEQLGRLALDLRKQDPLAWFKPYDIPAGSVSLKDYTVEKYQSADTAHLVSLRVFRFEADTAAWEYRKEVDAPLITNAVDGVSRQQLGSVKNLLTASSVNPDGKVYIPEYINGGTAEMYNVEVGTEVTLDRLEFHSANDLRPGIRLTENFGTIEDPLGINRLVVILPPALDAKLKIWMNLPDAIKHERREVDGRVVHVFENVGHEPLKRESAMPTEDLIPRVELYTDEDMLVNVGGLAQSPAPYYPSALVVETARTIRQTLPADATPVQQFDAVVHWVKTALRPGQGAVSFDDMIAMKVADDQPSRQELAQALCRALDLPVRDVVQYTTLNPFRDLPALKRRRFYEPSSLLTVHSAGMLALEDAAGDLHFRRIVGQQAHLWSSQPSVPAGLDGNSPLLNYIALAAPFGAEMRRYEGIRPVADGLRLQIELQVRADNTATLRGRGFLFGAAAGQIREQRTDARQRQILENGIVQWFWPQLEERRVEFIDSEDVERPLELGLVGRIGRLGQINPAAPADGISIPALAAQGRNGLSSILGLIGKTEREYDFQLEAHIDSTQGFFMPAVLAYEAPAGWAWAEVPEDLVLASEFGWYYCDYQAIGNRVEIHRGFMIPKQRLTPEQWKRFNSFLGAIRNYETLGKLVCKPLPPEAAYQTPCLSRGAERNELSW